MFVVSTHMTREIYISDVTGTLSATRILFRQEALTFVQHVTAKNFWRQIRGRETQSEVRHIAPAVITVTKSCGDSLTVRRR